MTPLFISSCDLAERMPAMAADFLELETRIGRRFREDSVTDIIIASLLKIGGSDATVLVPSEVTTGGDFDIVLYEPATGDSVQYRVQAKRLVPNLTNWEWSSYRELDHPHGTGGQASTLMRSSAQERIQTIPLYAFYNPQAVCLASGDAVAGIQLADGRELSIIIRALVKAKADGKRPRWKRIQHLRHLFFPLTTIFCPPTDTESTGLTIVSPRASRLAVEAAIDVRRQTEWEQEDAPPRLRSVAAAPPLMLPLDTAGTEMSSSQEAQLARSKDRALPYVITRALTRRAADSPIQKARVKRPRLVLISRQPAERK